jgi:hypothetical protein
MAFLPRRAFVERDKVKTSEALTPDEGYSGCRNNLKEPWVAASF